MDGNIQRRSGNGRPERQGTPLGGPRGSRAPAGRDGCHGEDLTLLVRAVETEVIPRLLSAHKAAAPAKRLPTLADVEQLAAHVLDSDSASAHRLIETLIDDGVGVEAVYLNLLGATARMLGEMWEQDRVNFIDVTVGLCTLHQILFRLAPVIEEDPSDTGRRALFAPVPGETHVFGALIVARFFTRAGWRTWTEISTERAMLVDLVRTHHFDVVGLSIACDRHVDALTETISALRAARSGMHILIGGHAVDTTPGLSERVGADASAGDPAEAVSEADRMVDRSHVNA